MRRLTKSLLRQLGLEIRLIRNSAFRAVGFEAWFGETHVTKGNIIKATVHGQDIFFFVTDELDLIQKEHIRGRFYEAEELQIIAEHFKGDVFIDIGANIGNHTIYAGKLLGATRIIAFEPNPAARVILKCNLALNNLENRVVHHAIGLSDRSGRATLTTPINNVGGTRLALNNQDGTIELARGDDLLRGESVDFIKLDTEGMEMQVLAGLTDTIERHRPAMFVEVEDENIAAFAVFTEQNSYRVAATYIRYSGLTNFLIVSR